MLDDPDLNWDKMLSEHIMKLHGKKRAWPNIDSGYTSQSGYQSSTNPGYETGYNTNFESDGGTGYKQKRSSYNSFSDQSGLSHMFMNEEDYGAM